MCIILQGQIVLSPHRILLLLLVTDNMSSFDPLVSATKVAAAFPESVRDKTILITGVSPKSLGLATAAALASQQPRRIILSGRSAEKVQSAAGSLTSTYPSVKYDVLLMDLSSQAFRSCCCGPDQWGRQYSSYRYIDQQCWGHGHFYLDIL